STVERHCGTAADAQSNDAGVGAVVGAAHTASRPDPNGPHTRLAQAQQDILRDGGGTAACHHGHYLLVCAAEGHAVADTPSRAPASAHVECAFLPSPKS